MKPLVSWRTDYPCQRRFGRLVKVDGPYAVIRYGPSLIRVPGKSITFEMG